MGYFVVSAATWIPTETSSAAASASSSGKIVTADSASTNFFELVEGGDWLINPATNEVSQIRTVDSENTLELFEPFESDMSSQTITWISNDAAKIIYCLVKNASGADITVDGETLPDGELAEFGQPNSAGYRRKFVRPFYLGSVTGNVQVSIEYRSNLQG